MCMSFHLSPTATPGIYVHVFSSFPYRHTRIPRYESNDDEVDEATAESEAEARATTAQRKDWEAACSACTNGDPPTLSAFLEVGGG